jgi:hypothetical protein
MYTAEPTVPQGDAPANTTISLDSVENTVARQARDLPFGTARAADRRPGEAQQCFQMRATIH